MAHGSWLIAHGSWLMAHGAWLIAHSSWLIAHGSWLIAHGYQHTMASACHCEGFFRSNLINRHRDPSIHPSFIPLINSIFLALEPPLICFSRDMAFLTSRNISEYTDCFGKDPRNDKPRAISYQPSAISHHSSWLIAISTQW